MPADMPLDILDTLYTHLLIPPPDGPGRCRGCDWESRKIGISSRLQHQAHVAAVIESEVADHVLAVKSEAWDEGYRSGHSRAMRRMSDEPGVAPGVNPYRGEVAR